MEQEPVTDREFADRLAELCCVRDAGFPRKLRDRHIMFRSVVQTLEARRFSERSLNEALRAWGSGIGRGIGIDHVTLRRYLVDAGYLRREADGTTYEVHMDGAGHVAFDPAVSRIDQTCRRPVWLLTAEEQRREHARPDLRAQRLGQPPHDRRVHIRRPACAGGPGPRVRRPASSPRQQRCEAW